VWYLLAADLVLLLHTLLVAFIVVGLLLIIAGGFRHWQWVRHVWFRSAHLLAIAVVVLQSWLGLVCPLTSWEMSLRAHAGEQTYAGSFISHWLQALLYYEVAPWVFVFCYSLFGLLVLLSWFWVRPRLADNRRNK
jgi:hypothetical protein